MYFTFGRILFLLSALAWMGLIYYLSSQSTIPVELVEGDTSASLTFRKLGHIVEFGVLGLFLLWGLGGWRRPSWKAYVLALGVTAVYAMLDEVHQGITPGRVGSVTDVLLDVLGVVGALILWKTLQSVRHSPLGGR